MRRSFDVLVIGGGFGGATVAHHLENLLAVRGRPGRQRVLLVAPENFFLFAPLLPEAASGTIEPRHAVIPLREMLRRTQLLVGEVTSIDLEARTAVAKDLTGARHDISWGQLVLSPGSVPSVIAVPGLSENAVGFKTLADAIWLRNRVLRQLETADATVDPVRRRELAHVHLRGRRLCRRGGPRRDGVAGQRRPAHLSGTQPRRPAVGSRRGPQLIVAPARPQAGPLSSVDSAAGPRFSSAPILKKGVAPIQPDTADVR